MRLLLVQHDPIGDDPAYERQRLAERLESEPAREGDLLLFPELASTAFKPELRARPELERCRMEDSLFYADLARRRASWVIAGVLDASAGEGHWKNLAILFDPSGRERGAYEKIHPFSFSGEDKAFPGGAQTTSWKVGDFQVQPAVCYDLRFPELFRARLDDGVNAFAVIANWPESRRRHWETLLSARAIENQAFVFAVNISGTVFGTPYFGGSRVVNPKGETIFTADREPGVYVVSVEAEDAARWRQAFPALRDRKLT